jgi:transposase
MASGGWFRPVPRKSVSAQETRALLTARKLLQATRIDVEMSLRGVLRGFGLKVGPTTPRNFAARIRELVEGQPTLTAVAEAPLAARETLGARLRDLERRLRDQAREDRRARLLMTTPGVGVIVALTHVAAVDGPHTVPLLEGGGGAFRPDAEAPPVRRDRRDRADQQDRRRRRANGAL